MISAEVVHEHKNVSCIGKPIRISTIWSSFIWQPTCGPPGLPMETWVISLWIVGGNTLCIQNVCFAHMKTLGPQTLCMEIVEQHTAAAPPNGLTAEVQTVKAMWKKKTTVKLRGEKSIRDSYTTKFTQRLGTELLCSYISPAMVNILILTCIVMRRIKSKKSEKI